jgi:signal transduction histidine kinase
MLRSADDAIDRILSLPGRRSALSLRSRLVLLITLSVVPLLLFVLASVYLNYREDRANAGQRTLELARSMALTLAQELRAEIAAMQALALSAGLHADDIVTFRAQAEALVAHQVPGATIVLLREDGQQVMNTALPPGASLPTRRELDNLRQVFATGHPAVSNLYQSVVLPRLTFAVDVPVYRADGSIAYDLALHPPLTTLAEVIRRQQLPEGWVVSVFDRRGVIIARAPNAERFVGHEASAQMLPHLLAERDGIIDTTSLEGIPLLTAFSRAEPYGWSVDIGVPWAQLTGPPLRAALLTFAVGGGLLGLTLVLVLIVARQITGPIAMLRRLAATADETGPARQGPTGLREADEVAEALRAAAARRREAEETRKRAEEDLRKLNETLAQHVAAAVVERDATQARLFQSQKLEAIGQLTGGIAHDFNNLLTSVIFNIDFMQKAVPDNETVRAFARSALRSAERGAKLVSQLLSFGRRQMLRPGPLMVDQALADMRLLIDGAVGEATEVRVSAEPGLWPCSVDRTQFESAMLNLAINARDAMPEGGRLSFTAENVIMATTDAARLDVAPGAYVKLTAADTGTGMPPDDVRQAFEPFFTTKDVGKGSGLGLSQVYGFVKQSGGAATIESALGKGTTVCLFLPKARSRAAIAHDPETRFEGPIRTEAGKTILIVEDEPDVLDALAASLNNLGYLALVARDASEAMALLASDAAIGLLFSDIVLPGGANGIELAHDAQRLRRDLRVLLTSGYPGEHWQHHRGAGEFEVLAKPYNQRELAEKIFDILRT